MVGDSQPLTAMEEERGKVDIDRAGENPIAPRDAQLLVTIIYEDGYNIIYNVCL